MIKKNISFFYIVASRWHFPGVYKKSCSCGLWQAACSVGSVRKAGAASLGILHKRRLGRKRAEPEACQGLRIPIAAPRNTLLGLAHAAGSAHTGTGARDLIRGTWL